MTTGQGFLRLPQIIGNPKAKPPILGLIPMSESAWYRGIAAGIYPKGIKLSHKMTVWDAAEVYQLIEDIKTLARGEQ